LKNANKTVKFLEGMEYHIGETTYDELQKVNIIYCQHPLMPSIEIIFKAEEEGPIQNLLKYSKENIYHICYKSVNPDESILLIKNDGFRVITVSKPKTAVLFNHKKVSFYYVRVLEL